MQAIDAIDGLGVSLRFFTTLGMPRYTQPHLFKMAASVSSFLNCLSLWKESK